MLTRDYNALDRSPYHLTNQPQAATTKGSISAPSLVTVPAAVSSAESFQLLSILLNALPNGLLVLSVDQDIVYWNQAAKRLCPILISSQRCVTMLPTLVAELCDQVLDAETTAEPVLVEYQMPDGRLYRLTACWLTASMGDRLSVAFNHQRYILVTVEDRDAVLQQDIQTEQKKFHLTNREAEIWLLLKREYSYQAIASALHISLNTVKTHVRNIHAKRHPTQSWSA